MDLNDILKEIDADQIKGLAKKVGIGEEKNNLLKSVALHSMKEEINKKKAEGKEEKDANLFGEKPNTDEEEKVAWEMEDNFATNIAEKLGLPDSVTSKLKGEMMQNMISGVQKKLSSEGVNSLDGIMDKFGDNELVDKYKKKLGL